MLKDRWNLLIVAIIVVIVLVVFLFGRDLTNLRTQVYQPIGTVSEEEAISGTWGALIGGAPYYMGVIAAPYMIPLALFLAVLLRKQGRWSLVFACFAGLFASFWISHRIERMRFQKAFHAAFSAVPKRAEPLIAAIEAHNTANGAYPESLDELVPEYLESIPDTGLAGYPQFNYRIHYRRTQSGETIRTYEIWFPTPIGGFNWDTFSYRPGGDYPDYGYEGALEFFGDWAYFHE